MGLSHQLHSIAADFYPDEKAPGCALMLWRRGEEPLFAARGIANLSSGEKITPDTTFRLASVSKQFTAAAVVQLCERGIVRLSQVLSDFFPGFPAYGEIIELHHLLRHTSGVKDYEGLIPPDQTTQVTDHDVLTLLSAQDTGDFLPGERFRYSNSGYALLAMVVKAASGQDFPEYVKEHLLNKAGMQTALAFVDGPDRPQPANRAIGYALEEDGQYTWSDQNVTTAVLGDGGIYCSVSDYARWIEAYLDGRIIGHEDLEKAFQPGKTADGEDVPYGYGWRLEPISAPDAPPVWRPYHPGSTSGFRNGAVVSPDGRWAALALTNQRNGDAVAVARAVGDLAAQSV